MLKKETSIIHLINSITKQLTPHFEFAQQHAWWIIQAITGKKKSSLITHQDITLTDEQSKQLHIWLDQLINQHKPLQYIIGSVPFADLEILVEPPVLIPRPETEEWCATLTQQLQQLTDQKLTILDLCSGSGCIALALAKALPKAMVYGIDIAHQAIALAKKNSIHNHITNVTFLHSDLFNSLSNTFKFNIIVANPPYISEQSWQQLAPSVAQWEDKNALVAPNAGDAILKKIITDAPYYIEQHNEMKKHAIPQLILEIGYDQGPIIQNQMIQNHFNMVKIDKDLAGKDRVVSGRIDNIIINKCQQNK